MSEKPIASPDERRALSGRSFSRTAADSRDKGRSRPVVSNEVLSRQRDEGDELLEEFGRIVGTKAEVGDRS
jgi:hypothetical protein